MRILKLERVFKALANRRRLEILDYLSKRGSATVGDIAIHLDQSLKATSRHVTKLANAGLIDRMQAGTYMFYHLAPNAGLLVNQILLTPYSTE